MPLKLIGYWYSRYEPQWPHPRRLSSLEPTVQANIVDYLRNGRMCAAYRGWSDCRFGCGRNGTTELTDGVFAWPEGLAHYVDVHSVRLPEQFVQHALANQFAIPVDRRDNLCGDPVYDLTFWSDWGRTEAPSRWINTLLKIRSRIFEWLTRARYLTRRGT